LPLLLAIELITFFATLIGTLLAVIPGAIVYAALLATTPSLIEERLGISASIERSCDLTRGSRGRIFLLVLLSIIFSAALIFLVIAAGREFQSRSAGVFSLRAGLVAAIPIFLKAPMISALYVELRENKEGPVRHDLAEVFR
jgi:hypothetical protein